MEVVVKYWDQLDEALATWVFKVNENCFIDVVIEGMVMDTLYELGCITNQDELFLKVEYLFSHWGIKWESVELIEA